MTFTPGSTSWASPLRLRGGEGDGDVFTSSPKRARETQMIVAIPPGHVNGSETRRSPPGFALPNGPFHYPEEVQGLFAAASSVAEREKTFPLKLHEHRTSVDNQMTEIVENYTELIKMLTSDINNPAKIDPQTASHMRDVLALLTALFEQFRNFTMQNEVKMSATFSDYKDIVTEQFGAVMKLELANLHNGLSLWRAHYMDQANTAVTGQRQLALEANRECEHINTLQKNLNGLILRHGLLLADKSASEQKLVAQDKDMGELIAKCNKLQITSKTLMEEQGATVAELAQTKAAKDETEKKLRSEVDTTKANLAEEQAEKVKIRDDNEARIRWLNQQLTMLRSEITNLKESLKQAQDQVNVGKAELASVNKKSESTDILLQEAELRAKDTVAKLTANEEALVIANNKGAAATYSLHETQRTLIKSQTALVASHTALKDAIVKNIKTQGELTACQGTLKQTLEQLTATFKDHKESLDKYQVLYAKYIERVEEVDEKAQAAKDLANLEADADKTKITALKDQVTTLKTTVSKQATHISKVTSANNLLAQVSNSEQQSKHFEQQSKHFEQEAKHFEQQAAIYRAVLDQHNNNPVVTQIKNTLMDKGLHKDQPFAPYVQGGYYSFANQQCQRGTSAPARRVSSVGEPAEVAELDGGTDI